jgi:prevent-host-death family protein
MEQIGVRELRRDASRWLARVRAGESFVITDRGDPIARLGPWVERGGYLALVADGALVQGSGRPLDDLLAAVNDELPEDPSEGPLGEALTTLRREER